MDCQSGVLFRMGFYTGFPMKVVFISSGMLQEIGFYPTHCISILLKSLPLFASLLPLIANHMYLLSISPSTSTLAFPVSGIAFSDVR